jgi:hypothetical protein
MEQKLVWGTGMISSRIGLGTWSLGGWMWGGSDDAAAIKTIRTALDGAVTSRIAVHSFDVVSGGSLPSSPHRFGLDE